MMLVLTRREEQGIRIVDRVVVKIVQVCGKRVRLGIEAPKSVPIDRIEKRELSLQSRKT